MIGSLISFLHRCRGTGNTTHIVCSAPPGSYILTGNEQTAQHIKDKVREVHGGEMLGIRVLPVADAMRMAGLRPDLVQIDTTAMFELVRMLDSADMTIGHLRTEVEKREREIERLERVIKRYVA